MIPTYRLKFWDKQVSEAFYGKAERDKRMHNLVPEIFFLLRGWGKGDPGNEVTRRIELRDGWHVPKRYGNYYILKVLIIQFN